MRVTRPTTPCYCTECDAEQSIKVRFENPKVGQQAGFALCDKHAEQLGNLLVNRVRRARFLAKQAESRSPLSPRP